MDSAGAKCSVCGQALALSSPPAGPVRCWLCHEAGDYLAADRLKRIEARRKRDLAEVRELDKRKQAEAGEGFRQKQGETQ